MMKTPDGCFQVVFLDSSFDALEEWLESRGHYLFRIPVTEDLVTFGIGIKVRVGGGKDETRE